MAKETGIGNALYVSGRDLSGETQSWGLNGAKAMQNTTTIRQPAFDRNGLLPDGAFTYESLMDTDVGHSHEYLSTLPTTDELVTLCHRETLGAVCWNMFNKQLNYDPTRPSDASLLFKVDGVSSKGSFWDAGNLVTAGFRTDTAAVNGIGVDMGANFADFDWGLQAYLHVNAHTGDDVVIKLQESSDNGVGDAWVDVVGGTFGTQDEANAPRGISIATARDQTVERYLRVVTTGTFVATSITFAVAVVVNTVEVRI